MIAHVSYSFVFHKTGIDNNSSTIAENFSTMIIQTTYTGVPINDFLQNFIDALHKEGFMVSVADMSPRPDQHKTFRITYQGTYIASTNPRLWARKTRPFCCEYRFPDANLKSHAKIPPNFDLDVFSKDHGCNPNRLRIDDQKKEGRYLWVEDAETALYLLRDWKQRIDGEHAWPVSGTEEQIVEDLNAILADTDFSETERMAQIKIRLGQGTFRKMLDDEFSTSCAVTGINVPEVLRASHIVPWRSSAPEQRLNSMNGLLLSANIDSLFDRYMITFRHNGELERSSTLTPQQWERLGPIGDLLVIPTKARAEFLKSHNAEFQKCERIRLAKLKGK